MVDVLHRRRKDRKAPQVAAKVIVLPLPHRHELVWQHENGVFGPAGTTALEAEHQDARDLQRVLHLARRGLCDDRLGGALREYVPVQLAELEHVLRVGHDSPLVAELDRVAVGRLVVARDGANHKLQRVLIPGLSRVRHFADPHAGAVPVDLYKLVHLTTLHMQDNNLTSVPAGVAELTALSEMLRDSSRNVPADCKQSPGDFSRNLRC